MKAGTIVKGCSVEKFEGIENTMYYPMTSIWLDKVNKHCCWAGKEMTVMGVVAGKYIIMEENDLVWEPWQLEEVF
jgi:hypothetical protein